MKPITLLHVSDVHFGISDQYADQPRSTRRLITDTHAYCEDNGIVVDVCVFTGDLTQKGADKEFEDGEKWLKDLVSPWNSKVFVVPGNHEVRRPTDNREKENIKMQLRRASKSQSEFQTRNNGTTECELLNGFFEWHKNFKKDPEMNVVSDWSTPTVCKYVKEINGLPICIIGLNTATLSCDNDDRGNLAVDIESLNSTLADIDPDNQLVVVAGHHPIGKQSNQKWLASWNGKKVESLLLQSTGPHIYLHGHLHSVQGASINLTQGQNLTFFGAGACYRKSKRPMMYAIYEVDTSRQEIKPSTFEFDKVSGRWNKTTKGPGSNPIRATLPRLEKGRSQQYDYVKDIHNPLCEKISQAVKQLYPADDQPRHHFSKIDFYCRVDRDGTCEVRDVSTIVAEDKHVHLWNTYISPDDESPKIELHEQLNLKVRDCGGKHNAVFLPTENGERSKGFCIFFLPRIKPREKRTIEITYNWPRYIAHLLEGKTVYFACDFITSSDSQLCDLRIEVAFHPEIDFVKCDNVGTIPDDYRLNSNVDADGWLSWVFEAENAVLQGNSYSLAFSRAKAS